MVEASRDVLERLMTGLKGASMARPYRKAAQMYLGSYGVSWFDEPPHGRPWVVHNTNVEDGDEIRMEGFANLACGNTPPLAIAPGASIALTFSSLVMFETGCLSCIADEKEVFPGR